MAKKFRTAGGGVPGPNRKIVDVNRAQGVKGISNMQGTTRIIYDAVKLAATTGDTSITLFQNCNTRQFPLTNLTENKLQVGESIAMQRFSCLILTTTTGTTNLVGVSTLNFFPQFSRLYGAQMNFNIAQDQVIKQQPLMSLFAPFNQHSKFMSYFSTQPLATDPVTGYNQPHDVYKFDNDIVIPPQIQFYATFTIPPVTLPAGNDFYFCMMISGLGSLYAPKSTY